MNKFFPNSLVLTLVCLLTFNTYYAKAQHNPGDTIRVRVHDAVNMTWYGNYDVWGLFPDTSVSFRKITMFYTMGCASTGCSDWDYTTKVELINHTGVIDSSLQSHPWFKVNNNNLDTFAHAITPNFTTSWNNGTDTIWSAVQQVVFFDSSLVPPQPYDTLNVYPANYWYMVFDSTGAVVDSVFVAADDTLFNTTFQYYMLFEVLAPYELARVITPYGGYMRAGQQGFNNAWTFTHAYDVTAFAPMLRDSVHMRAFYDGWSSGFSITLDFEMIVGTPPHETKRIENLWRGGFAYQNSASFETNFLPERKISFMPSETAAFLRIIPSGHGFDNNVNCAEFCPRSYYVKVNSTQVSSNLMWDDKCGFNPIYPQAGTWIYNRANWCPGTTAKIFNHNISSYISHSDTVAVDLDIQDYTWSGTQTPYYYIDAQLLTFGSPNFNTDAELYDIITPSLKDEFARLNPICSNPVVVVRNSGAQTLTSLTIEYGYKGQTPLSFAWTGSLAFMETDTVTLTGSFFETGTESVFFAQVKNPNSTTDQHMLNDYMETPFNVPDVITENRVVVELKTNNAGWQSSWEVTDVAGNVVAMRNNMANNSTNRDTISLINGACYVFTLLDAGGNGLSFFAGNEGTGYVRLRKATGAALIKTFNANFGSKIVYPFKVGEHAGIQTEEGNNGFSIYPNPTTGDFILGTNGREVIAASLYDVRGASYQLMLTDAENNNYSLSTGNIAPGFYFLKIETPYGPAVLKLAVTK